LSQIASVLRIHEQEAGDMATATLKVAAPPTGTHVREHSSVLAAAERRLLIWIAQRLPGWLNSDHLTALGALAMAGAAAAFAAASIDVRWLALVPVLLAVNWFGDSLDGTVARVRNQQRPRYGFYLDHVVDIANTTVLLAGLALSGLCSPWIAIALMVGYLLLCGESFLATHALGVFRISFAGMGPTELRLLLSVGALAAMSQPNVRPFGLGPFQLFDVGGVVGAIGMAVVFVLSAARNTRALYVAEPLPARAVTGR
jgi:archaetidylinositol phosphate synthase